MGISPKPANLVAFIVSIWEPPNIFFQDISCFNQTPSCKCSMCLYCKGKVSNCSIKSCGRSWLAHEGTMFAYTKALLGKNCLSSHSCHLSKLFFVNQTPSCICSMCLHCIGKVSNCSIKSCSRSWSAHEGTIYAYTKALLGGKLSKFSQLSFCQKSFFLNQTPSCICSMCLHCIGKVSNRPLSHYRNLPVSSDISWPVQQLDYFRYMKL